MTAPSTFERVYQAIKGWLVTGDYRPGARLEPLHLSERLNSSVTPVRDALHRLTGERMVDAPRNEGFRVPLASEVSLRHLYAWHRDLLLLAVANHALDRVSPSGDPAAGHTRLEREHSLFVALAEATGNLEHAQALRALLERLEPYQRLEDGLLDALSEETDAICRAIENGDRRALRRLLMNYHRIRARVIAELVALARVSDSDGRVQ